MKKQLLSLAAIALSIGSAQAGVAINETNFPDENMLWAMQAIDDNDEEWGHNGILDDEEIGAINDYFLSLSGVTNFKGIEYFYDGLKTLLITGLNDPDVPTTNLDLTKFTKLERLEIGGYPDITSLDFTNSPNLTSLYISTMAGLTTVQIPASIANLIMYWNPKLTTVNLDACRENLDELHMQDVAIKDVDVSNFKNLHRIYIDGNDAENVYKLNSLNIAGCDNLWSISIQCTDIETVTIKDLPEFGEATVSYNDIRKLTVENCPKLVYLDCQDNKLPELHIKKCEAFWRIFATNNYMRTLIIDESPLQEVEAEDNQLMWLDLSKVVFEKDRLQDTQAPLKINNQHPSVDAYKLSPTEVGILVHERFDASRVKNLEAGGVPVPNPTFAEYDGVKYFVVSIDGENAENLQGWKTKYEYDTKWPYPWIEGNSPNNCLQVNLNVNKLHKLDAWMKFKTTAFDEPLVGVVGGDPLVGANPDTDIEYSKAYREGEGSVSFASSDESVVKVDPYSGELTVVGPGTATITISGIATYYRNAPKSISYKVKIYKPGDANGDGNVDAADIVEAVNFKLGTSSAKFIMAAADMNGDGNIDETDILQIVSIILGK